jgi:hypothetical protein
MWSKIALWALKLGGILIMVTGFYIRNVEFYPSIFNSIVPEYSHAVAGLKKLTVTFHSLPVGRLLPEDDGFQQLSQIYFNNLSAMNNNRPIPADIKIESFQPSSSTASLGKTISMQIIINLYSVSTPINGAIGKVKDFRSLDFFTDSLNEMKHKKLFKVGKNVFLFGLAIEVLAVGIDVFFYIPSFLKKRNAN